MAAEPFLTNTGKEPSCWITLSRGVRPRWLGIAKRLSSDTKKDILYSMYALISEFLENKLPLLEIGDSFTNHINV